jgi:hypothetical protein
MRYAQAAGKQTGFGLSNTGDQGIQTGQGGPALNRSSKSF